LQQTEQAAVRAVEEGTFMTQVKHSCAALAIAGLIAGAGWAAAQQSHQAPMKGTAVTLTACVERAQKDGDDKFVLTHVADVPTQPAPHGRVVYWIEKVDTIKPHVGHQIRLSGKITDVDKNEIETKKGGTVVEIEGHGKEVKTTPEKAGVPRSDHDVPTTVLTLSVDKVEMVAAKCLLGR
jgi:hypothetical protein